MNKVLREEMKLQELLSENMGRGSSMLSDPTRGQ